MAFDRTLNEKNDNNYVLKSSIDISDAEFNEGGDETDFLRQFLTEEIRVQYIRPTSTEKLSKRDDLGWEYAKCYLDEVTGGNPLLEGWILKYGHLNGKLGTLAVRIIKEFDSHNIVLIWANVSDRLHFYKDPINRKTFFLEFRIPFSQAYTTDLRVTYENSTSQPVAILQGKIKVAVQEKNLEPSLVESLEELSFGCYNEQLAQKFDTILTRLPTYSTNSTKIIDAELEETARNNVSRKLCAIVNKLNINSDQKEEFKKEPFIHEDTIFSLLGEQRAQEKQMLLNKIGEFKENDLPTEEDRKKYRESPLSFQAEINEQFNLQQELLQKTASLQGDIPQNKLKDYQARPLRNKRLIEQDFNKKQDVLRTLSELKISKKDEYNERPLQNEGTINALLKQQQTLEEKVSTLKGISDEERQNFISAPVDYSKEIEKKEFTQKKILKDIKSLKNITYVERQRYNNEPLRYQEEIQRKYYLQLANQILISNIDAIDFYKDAYVTNVNRIQRTFFSFFRRHGNTGIKRAQDQIDEFKTAMNRELLGLETEINSLSNIKQLNPNKFKKLVGSRLEILLQNAKKDVVNVKKRGSNLTKNSYTAYLLNYVNTLQVSIDTWNLLLELREPRLTKKIDANGINIKSAFKKIEEEIKGYQAPRR
jgi:hypothetical protein